MSDEANPILVQPAESMLLQEFRNHCRLRHPRLGFWAKGEHAAVHRLHQADLDHVHAEGDTKSRAKRTRSQDPKQSSTPQPARQGKSQPARRSGSPGHVAEQNRPLPGVSRQPLEDEAEE